MKSKVLIQIICLLLILLFTYAGFSKLADHAMFFVQLVRFPWMSPMAAFISWFAPLAELAIALLLLFPSTRLYGLYGSLLLLVLFTVYLAMMVSMKVNLPCSCGGVISQLSWRQHIFFNLFFIALASAGIYLMKNRVPIKPI